MDIERLSDKRSKIKRGRKTLYVNCTQFPVIGEFGDIEQYGNYTIDDGSEIKKVAAVSLEEAVQMFERGDIVINTTPITTIPVYPLPRWGSPTSTP